jgi:RNA polymerase sigma-70 factor (ECF subfamily)
MDRPRDHSRSRAEYLAESSVELVGLIQAGDALALDVLCQRYLPILQRWASGRLPHRARDLVETGDIVQETVVRMLRQIDRFEVRRDGALLAYLRSGIMNRIRDEARRVGRRPDQVDVDDVVTADRGPSPLEQLIGSQALASYESALAQLRESDREAIIGRLELDLSFEELARALGKDSANTARMTFNRALLRLAEGMSRVT